VRGQGVEQNVRYDRIVQSLVERTRELSFKGTAHHRSLQ
jgi:hypothetical protein